MACKFCGADGPMVKAHIVPESFYPPRDKGKEKLILAGSNPSHRTKRVPTGIYDPDLVCRTHERLFDPWDSYAANLLLKDGTVWNEMSDKDGVHGYQVEDFDYALLKLFALSVVWRAGASSREEFRAVRLGPYQNVLKELLEGSEPGGQDDFGVCWVRYSQDGVNGSDKIWISPVPSRVDRVRYYWFIFGGYEMFVKMDRQSAPDWIRDLQISSGAPLTMLAKKFKESRGYSLARAMARQIPNRLLVSK